MLGDWPPSLIRFIARSGIGRGARQLKDKEVAARGKLTLKTVGRLSKLDTWSKVEIGLADQFMAACGFDLAQQHLHCRFIRRAIRTGLRFCAVENPSRRRSLPNPETLARAASGGRAAAAAIAAAKLRPPQ